MSDMSPSTMYYRDIISLCRIDKKAVHFFYQAYIITEQGEVECDEVLSLDCTKDYELAFADDRVLTVSMTKQKYIRHLYPIKDNFKIKIKQTQVSEKESGMRLMKPDIYERQYKGVLVDPKDYGTDSESSSTAFSNEDENQKHVHVEVKIQLIELAVEQIMKTTFGGNFQGVIGDICKMMLTEGTKHLKVERPYQIRGVHMEKPDNTKSYVDVLIPHGTKLTDIPRYLQEKWYGIFNKSIGSYIAQESWFVYPIYDYDRYTRSETKLTLSILPKGEMLENLRTFHVLGREVNVICAGGVEQFDLTQEKSLNEGDGVTYYEGNTLKQELVKQEGDKVYVDASAAKKQIVKNDREDGLTTAPVSKDRLNSSLAKAMSSVAAKEALVVSMIWEYANPDLLVPGMPAKIIFFKGEKRMEAMGTLLKHVSVTQKAGNTAYKKHLSSVALVIVVDKNTIKGVENKAYKKYNQGVVGGLFETVSSWFK